MQDIEKVTNILLALDYYDFLLTKAQSRIVRLYHESNLTFEEIGEELGMSKQNALPIRLFTCRELGTEGSPGHGGHGEQHRGPARAPMERHGPRLAL